MKWIPLFLLLLTLFACQKSQQETSKPAPAVENQKVSKIVAFGNSLTAGLGLEAQDTYPAQLQKLLEADGYKYEVVNAGISGDTSSGGLRRLDWTIDDDVKIVVLELGGNDILRGQPMDLTIKNLSQIIEQLRARKIDVVLAGIEAPTNSGPEYRQQVHEAYQTLAQKYQLPFIPFLLVDLIGKDGTIQPDGTHPTAKGARIVAQTVYAKVKPLLGNSASLR
jgi:acyl-CoA thioesterase I